MVGKDKILMQSLIRVHKKLENYIFYCKFTISSISSTVQG